MFRLCRTQVPHSLAIEKFVAASRSGHGHDNAPLEIFPAEKFHTFRLCHTHVPHLLVIEKFHYQSIDRLG